MTVDSYCLCCCKCHGYVSSVRLGLSSAASSVPCACECVVCNWSCRWICAHIHCSSMASHPCESSSVSDTRQSVWVSFHICHTCTTCPICSLPCGAPARVWPSVLAVRKHGRRWCRCTSPPPQTAASPGPHSPAGRYLKLHLKFQGPPPAWDRSAPRCLNGCRGLRSGARCPACFPHLHSGTTGRWRCSAPQSGASPPATAPPPPPPPWWGRGSSHWGWSPTPAAHWELRHNKEESEHDQNSSICTKKSFKYYKGDLLLFPFCITRQWQCFNIINTI